MVEGIIKRAPTISEYDNQDNESLEFQSQRIDLFNLCHKKLSPQVLSSPVGQRIAGLMGKTLAKWNIFYRGFENNLWPIKYANFLEKELEQFPNKSLEKYVAHFSAIETVLGLTNTQKWFLKFLPESPLIKPDSVDEIIRRDINSGAKLVIMSSVIATNPIFLLKRIVNAVEIKERNKRAEELKFKLVFQHPEKLEYLALNESSKYVDLLDYAEKNPEFKFSYKSIRGHSPHWVLRYLRHLRVFALTIAGISQLKAISDEYFGRDFIEIEFLKNVMTFRGNTTVGGEFESTIFQVIPAFVQSLYTIAKATTHDILKKELYKEIQPSEGREACSADSLHNMFDYCLESEASMLNTYSGPFRKAYATVYSEKIPSYQEIINQPIPEKDIVKDRLFEVFAQIGKLQDEVDRRIIIGTPARTS